MLPLLEQFALTPVDNTRFVAAASHESHIRSYGGQIIAQASGDKDELLVSDLDMNMVREVRNLWQFFRDRRPETYGGLTEQR